MNILEELIRDENIPDTINGVKIFDKPIAEILSHTHLAYHNENHVYKLYKDTINSYITVDDKTKLLTFIIALFHDIVYKVGTDPANEYESNRYFMHWYYEYNVSKLLNYEDRLLINDTILATTLCLNNYSIDYKNLYERYPIVKMDRIGLLQNILQCEYSDFINIRKENILYDYDEFIKGHLAICEYICKTFGYSFKEIGKDYVNNLPKDRIKTIGIYCGSFDPFHIGHLDIVNKAKELFDLIIIAKGINPDKSNEPIDNNITYNYEIYNKTGVKSVYYGSVFDLYEKYSKYAKVTFIKGFRNGEDVNYDMKQTRIIQDIIPVNFVYIPSDQKYEHISSSAIRELNRLCIESKRYLPL